MIGKIFLVIMQIINCDNIEHYRALGTLDFFAASGGGGGGHFVFTCLPRV